MSQPLRVCLVHNVVAPYRLPLFEHLSQQLDLDVWFCQTITADRRWDTDRTGYTFRHRILASRQLGPFVLNPSLLWHLLRHRYDVYLVGDFPEVALTTFLVILVAKLRRRPIVLWSETLDHEVNYFQHLTVSPHRRHRLLRRVLTTLSTGYRRLLLSLPSQYLALSQLARTFLLHEGIPASRIHSGLQVMPAALLPAATIPKAASPYAHHRTILSLGYLNPSKGLQHLIAAFSQLPEADLRLIIAGSGPSEASLRAQAAADPRIIFTGYIADATDRANYFTWADVFVLPTLVDCWGLVVNEAMHYGTPVITTTIAGASELLRPTGGLIVPPQNTAALASALRQLLHDPAQRHRLSQANLARTDITDTAMGAAPILAAIRAAGGKS